MTIEVNDGQLSIILLLQLVAIELSDFEHVDKIYKIYKTLDITLLSL